MYIKIIRGLGQIGGNIIEIGTKKNKIIFDCGTELAPLDDANFKDTMSIDGLMFGEKKYDAVFISHYHGDHIGLVNKIIPKIPVYASIETVNQVEKISKIINHNHRKITAISKKITVGDINVTPFPVEHSAIGAFMYLIEADGKSILYSGDFSKATNFVKDVDILLCEGTNMGFTTKSKLTEIDVINEIEKTIKTTSLPTFLITTTANYNRIHNLYRLCAKLNRPFVSDLTSYMLIRDIKNNEQEQTNPLKFYMHNFIEKSDTNYDFFKNNEKFIMSKTDILKSNALILVRKNELQIPLLNELKPICGQFSIANMIKQLSQKGKIKLIYSTWSGYKQELKFGKSLQRLVNEYDVEIIDIHASGHIFKEELVKFIKELNPKKIIPIHTEHTEEFGKEFNNVIYLANNQEMEV